MNKQEMQNSINNISEGVNRIKRTEYNVRDGVAGIYFWIDKPQGVENMRRVTDLYGKSCQQMLDIFDMICKEIKSGEWIGLPEKR